MDVKKSFLFDNYFKVLISLFFFGSEYNFLNFLRF